jgi:hypothetical protein
VLAALGSDRPQIGTKSTHVVRETAALLDRRGGSPGRQIEEGEEVTLVMEEGELAQIAQDGKLLGFIDKSKLLKLKPRR